MAELNDKQLRFVDEYIIDLNATQAAIRAGYSPKTANEQGARLLAHVSVKAAIDAKMAKRAKKTNISQEWVLKQLQRVYKRCMQVTPITDSEGNPLGEYKFEHSGANKSLELIGKHLGMFSDKIKVSGDPDSPPIQIKATTQAIESRIAEMLNK